MFQRELETAVNAARTAGARVLALYESGVEVSWKAGDEPVTEADMAANEIILGILRKTFPDDAILSEESKDDPSRLKNSRVWVVDPLDGTQEFVDRVGQFAVMIGLAVAGKPVVGAVFQPTTGRCWYAAEGFGAYIESPDTGKKELRVSSRTVSDGIHLVLTRSHPFAGVEELQEKLKIAKTSQIGSVGLKVGALATGDAELYVHISQHTKEWDSCAPHAILEQAGGVLTDLAGEPIRYNREVVANKTGLLASNGLVHEESVEVVRPLAITAGILEA